LLQCIEGSRPAENVVDIGFEIVERESTRRV